MSYIAHTVDNGGATTGYDPKPLIPTGIAVGDLLVAIMQTSHLANVTITPPAGWTLEASGSMPVATSAASDSAIWIYTRVADQGDVDDVGTAAYTWTFTGAEEQCGVMVLLDPAEWGQFATDLTAATTATTSGDSPSVTTTLAAEVVFYCGNKDSGVAFSTFPSGDATMVNETYGTTDGAGASLGIVREEIATPSATGAKTFTLPSEQVVFATFSVRALARALGSLSGEGGLAGKGGLAGASGGLVG